MHVFLLLGLFLLALPSPAAAACPPLLDHRYTTLQGGDVDRDKFLAIGRNL